MVECLPVWQNVFSPARLRLAKYEVFVNTFEFESNTVNKSCISCKYFLPSAEGSVEFFIINKNVFVAFLLPKWCWINSAINNVQFTINLTTDL